MTGAAFVAELLAALPPDGQRAALRVLSQWQGVRLTLPAPHALAAQRRAHAVDSLRRAGLSRADVARILRARFGLSERHARRLAADGQRPAARGRAVADTRASVRAEVTQ